MTTPKVDPAGRRELPVTDREQQVLDRIDRARRRAPRVREDRITMSHGSGGKATHTLIEAIFLGAFRNPLLEPLEDSAELSIEGSRVALTTDSYVVSPLFFPDPGSAAAGAVDAVEHLLLAVGDRQLAAARRVYLRRGHGLPAGAASAIRSRCIRP